MTHSQSNSALSASAGTDRVRVCTVVVSGKNTAYALAQSAIVITSVKSPHCTSNISPPATIMPSAAGPKISNSRAIHPSLSISARPGLNVTFSSAQPAALSKLPHSGQSSKHAVSYSLKQTQSISIAPAAAVRLNVRSAGSGGNIQDT